MDKVDKLENHYDDKYFKIQKKCGKLGAESCIHKFLKYINPGDDVLEFGCGTGYYLERLNVEKKIGIEVNPVAIEHARGLGLDIRTSLDEVEDNSIDVIYSHHVLEHVPNPLETLKTLKQKLKNNGKMIFVMPYDPHFLQWHPDDRNKHLYTWNSMTAGNLFSMAGFKVNKIWYNRYQWPPGAYYIRKFFGVSILNILSTIYAYLFGYREVQIVVEKAYTDL